jgi:hypothetical protein
MAIVLAAGTGRLILVVGLTVFAAFHIQALLETREIEAILARSISRTGFVISYWLGLSLLAVILTTAFGLLIATATRFTPGAFLWAGTLLAECTIVLAVVLFAALMLERATSAVLFTLGFYALARLMGFFVGIREAVDPTVVMRVAQRALDFVLLFIPRLDLFAQTRWIVYEPIGQTTRFIGLETPLFLALVLGASVFDLRRKQF